MKKTETYIENQKIREIHDKKIRDEKIAEIQKKKHSKKKGIKNKISQIEAEVVRFVSGNIPSIKSLKKRKNSKAIRLLKAKIDSNAQKKQEQKIREENIKIRDKANEEIKKPEKKQVKEIQSNSSSPLNPNRYKHPFIKIISTGMKS